MKNIENTFDTDISLVETQKTFTEWWPKLKCLSEQLGHEEALAQLAEEGAELSQAALKLRRVLVGKSPTPVTEADAWLHVQEEIADVLIAAVSVGIDDALVSRFVQTKMARWTARVKENSRFSG